MAGISVTLASGRFASPLPLSGSIAVKSISPDWKAISEVFCSPIGLPTICWKCGLIGPL
jgi:hypothetical protein